MLSLHHISLTVIIGILLSVAGGARADTNTAAHMLSVNSLDSTISIYHVTPQGMVQQQGFYPTAKNPKAVVVHPTGKFAYLVAKTANVLVSYELVKSAGRMELRHPTSYNIPAKSPFSLVIHPTGEFLYVAAREGKIAAYRINLLNGVLTPVQPPLVDSQYRTRSLVIHGSGKFLYAVNAYANSISAYGIDTASGGLTPLPDSPFAVIEADVEIRSLYPLADVPPEAGGIPYYAALEPQGRFLYVSNWGGGKISAFSIDPHSGSLRPLPGSPYETGLNPYALAVHPSGRYLYAGSWKSNSLWAYAIDQNSGALTGLAGKSFESGGSSPVSIVFNAAGSMAYVANAESANIGALQVNSDTGELSLLHTTQTRPGPWWLSRPLATANPSYRVKIYTSNYKTHRLSLWEAGFADNTDVHLIDAVTLPVGALPAVQERRGTIYAADVNSKSIFAYQLNNTQGRFVQVDQSPWAIPGTPVDVKFDFNGWYLYVVCKNPDLLMAFGIDDRNAALIPVSQPVPLPFAPSELALDPAARYAYVFSADGQKVSLFSYRQNTGALLYERSRFGSPFALKGNPSAALIDAGANFMMLTHGEHNTIATYKIDALSGAITATGDSPFALNSKIAKIAMHHSGRFVYVLDESTSKLLVYSRNALTGTIDNRYTSLLDLSHNAISAITIHQDELYLADNLSKSLLVYSVDPNSGILQRITRLNLQSAVDSVIVTAAD